jgi:hypothetical protein
MQPGPQMLQSAAATWVPPTGLHMENRGQAVTRASREAPGVLDMQEDLEDKTVLPADKISLHNIPASTEICPRGSEHTNLGFGFLRTPHVVLSPLSFSPCSRGTPLSSCPFQYLWLGRWLYACGPAFGDGSYLCCLQRSMLIPNCTAWVYSTVQQACVPSSPYVLPGGCGRTPLDWGGVLPSFSWFSSSCASPYSVSG